MNHKRLEGYAIYGLGLIKRPGWPYGTKDASVKIVKFLVNNQLPLNFLGEYRQSEGNQQVLKDSNVSLYRFSIHAAVAGDRAKI